MLRAKALSQADLALNYKIKTYRDFPGGPVAQTPCFHSRDPGLIPGQDIRFYIRQLKKKKKIPHAERRFHVPQVRPGAAK